MFDGLPGAAGLWFAGDLYGCAHGLMASLVAQFGGVPHVALVAGGRDRARPRKAAHRAESLRTR